ncbi:hypothetical protein Nmel_014841 [Mimus melanotis]
MSPGQTLALPVTPLQTCHDWFLPGCGSQQLLKVLFCWPLLVLTAGGFLPQAVERHPKLVPHPLFAVAFLGKVQGLGKVLDAGTSDWNPFLLKLMLFPNLTNLPAADQNHCFSMHWICLMRMWTKYCRRQCPASLSPLMATCSSSITWYIPEATKPTGEAGHGEEYHGPARPAGEGKDLATCLDQESCLGLPEGCQRAACILELFQDAVKKRANNTLQATFQTVPFLPAVLPTGDNVLLPAASSTITSMLCYAEVKLQPLQGGSPSFLGLDQQIPSAPVFKLQALSHSSSTLPLETQQDSNNCCYKQLNMLLWEHHSSWDEVASAVAQGEPFILVGSRFVPITAVAETLSFEAVPYLHQFQEQYKPYREL